MNLTAIKSMFAIPKDFNFKESDLLKLFGVILILDGLISLVHPGLAHTAFFDLGRVIRTGIGVYLLAYRPK